MILDKPSKPHRTMPDCQFFRVWATIVALGKAIKTRLIMLRCINCQRFRLPDRVPSLRVDVDRYHWRAILRP
jgi:hypothetical protein